MSYLVTTTHVQGLLALGPLRVFDTLEEAREYAFALTNMFDESSHKVRIYEVSNEIHESPKEINW